MNKSKTIHMTKKDIAWLFACIILAVSLAVSIYLGYAGFYSSLTYLKSQSDLVVGNNVSVEVNPNEASVVSFTFDGSYLPNESVPQVIKINASLLDEDLLVRVKAVVFGTDYDVDFETTDHFLKNEDGYYYYDDVLSGGNIITFCNAIIMPEGTVSGEQYILSVIVETLSEDVENIWQSE